MTFAAERYRGECSLPSQSLQLDKVGAEVQEEVTVKEKERICRREERNANKTLRRSGRLRRQAASENHR